MLNLRSIPVLLAALWLLAPNGGTARAEGADGAFRRAHAAYEAGRYDLAADGYRSLLEEGYRDARLEYNLGNTEFRRGRLGVAILHFERARRLAPTDAEVAANLALARSLILDQVEQPELPAPLRGLRWLQDRLGPDRLAWTGVALLWLVAALLGWSLSSPGRWRPLHGWLLASLLLAGLGVGLAWWDAYQRLEARPLAVVLAESVEVLAGPGASNPTLFTVHEGITLEVRSEREDWVQVGLPNGLNGWLSRDAIGRV